MGPRRAGVLIALHVVIIGHVLWWYFSGPEGARKPTLSPIEPSESMFTLEQGLVNAGFVFFAGAIISTLLLGRWVCGWGCHIVALQDLCAWMMKKLGVRPRPFRSRLLMFAPLVLALYMFVWPTVKREVLVPALGPERWTSVAPYLGEAPQRPAFKAAFMKEDFWETFPPWFVAVPFLLVCGFGCVYFLGSKGYCNYGCPYGGFFGPAELVAPGKIVVDHDKCEQCGHCTAVCTSNVRVHEEIRDFGKVVDPGCFKCMDCVSVCPNQALSFSFSLPTVFTRPRDPAAAERARDRKRVRKLFDLGPWQEILWAGLFLAMAIGFRNMLNQVPLLMAMGCAAIAVFCAWKLWALFAEKNVTHLNIQLKLRGRLRPAGALFALVSVAIIGAGTWGLFVRYNLWRGAILDGRLTAPADVVLAKGYSPAPADKALADAAIAHFKRAGAWDEGGYGWRHGGENYLRMSWLSAVAGRLDDSEQYLRTAIERGNPSDDTVLSLGQVMHLKGATPQAIIAEYRKILEPHPDLYRVRLMVAQVEANLKNAPAAAREAEFIAASDTTDPRVLSGTAELYLRLENAVKAAELLRRAIAAAPDDAGLHSGLGVALYFAGERNAALAEMRKAAELGPDNPIVLQRFAEILREFQQFDEAARVMTRVRELQQQSPPR